MADGDQMGAFNGVVVAWLAALDISCISAQLLVGSLEVKVKTWMTTSADAVPSFEAVFS